MNDEDGRKQGRLLMFMGFNIEYTSMKRDRVVWKGILLLVFWVRSKYLGLLTYLLGLSFQCHLNPIHWLPMNFKCWDQGNPALANAKWISSLLFFNYFEQESECLGLTLAASFFIRT